MMKKRLKLGASVYETCAGGNYDLQTYATIHIGKKQHATQHAVYATSHNTLF